MAKVAPRLETLRRRADFISASSDGVKIGGPIIGLQVRDRGLPDDPPRIGFTATKRVGGSVERSRMKRRMRAAAGAVLSEAGRNGCDYVLIARRAVLNAPFERLLRDLRDATRRAHGRSRAAELVSPPPAGTKADADGHP